MSSPLDGMFREQLIERRARLKAVAGAAGPSADIQGLLAQVDAALARMQAGTFGICSVCQDPIDTGALVADPLLEVCLDHLNPAQQRALEADLALAARIQRGLLPPNPVMVGAWTVCYHYEPAEVVSGDYCDLIPGEDGGLHFIIGDVSGKGVAASMLMPHLHAMFRSLIPLGLPLGEVAERASRILCESTLPTHFATLVCGRAEENGWVEICNAGHVPPLLAEPGGIKILEATGLPLGIFCDTRFSVDRVHLDPGQILLLYTDGLTEARNTSGEQYGEDRAMRVVDRNRGLSSEALLKTCLEDLAAFRGQSPRTDDLTLMVVRRE